MATYYDEEPEEITIAKWNKLKEEINKKFDEFLDEEELRRNRIEDGEGKHSPLSDMVLEAMKQSRELSKED
jgi:hypothetical protein